MANQLEDAAARPKSAKHVSDVSAQKIARVYAEALLNAAAKRQEAEEVGAELDAIVDGVMARQPAFAEMLGAGALNRNVKQEIVQRAFEGRVHPLTYNLLQVLNRHDRLDLLRLVRLTYREAWLTRTGRVTVLVRSAAPLPSDQRERLANDIRTTLRLEPTFEEFVEPDLLGGLVLRIGDRLYDASVRSRLMKLRNQLIEKSSHEIQSRRDRFSPPS